MQSKWPWFERKFNFDFPAEKMPEIVERLVGTTLRIEAAVADLDETVLTKRETVGSWSIKARVDDMLDGRETMREADLTNQSTIAANFNSQQVDAIVSEFQRQRRE